MASRLQIIIDNTPLDLFEGTEDQFYVTLQVFDVASFESRNASFSRSFAVPLSPQNQQLLGFPTLAESNGGRSYERIPCSVLLDGVPIFSFAELVVVQSKRLEEVEVTVLSDNFEFFVNIPNIALGLLDFSQFDYTPDVKTVQSLMTDQQQVGTTGGDLGLNVESTVAGAGFLKLVMASDTYSAIEVDGIVFFSSPDESVYPSRLCKVLDKNVAEDELEVDIPYVSDITGGKVISPREAGFCVPYMDFLTREGAAEIYNEITGQYVSTDFRSYNIRLGGFSLSFLTILEKIISLTGFTPNYDRVENLQEVRDTHLIGAYDLFIPKEGRQSEIDGEVVAAGGQGNSTDLFLEQRIEFDSYNQQVDITYNFTTQEYEITQDSDNYRLRLSVLINLTRSKTANTSTVVRIRQGATILASATLPDQTGQYRITLSEENIAALNGDVFYATIDPGENGGNPIPPANHDQFEIVEGSLFLDTPEGAESDIIPSNWLPDVLLRDFMRGALQLFGLVINANPATRIVEFIDINDIFNGENPVDQTSTLDVSRPVEFFNSVGNYTQYSLYNYVTEADVFRRDLQAINLSDNQRLDVEGFEFISLFYASDKSSFDGDAKRAEKIRYPVFTYEQVAYLYETGTYLKKISGFLYGFFDSSNVDANPVSVDVAIGDYLTSDSFGSAIVEDVNEEKTEITLSSDQVNPGANGSRSFWFFRSEGEVDKGQVRIARIDAQLIGTGGCTVFDGNGFGQGGRLLVAPPLLATLPFETMSWKNILQDKYASFLNSIDKPQIYKAWFVLPLSQLTQIDLTRIVYLRQFNSYFYINKIEQWKIDGSARVELVKVAIGDRNIEII